MMFSMSQTGGRLPIIRKDGQPKLYYNYPFGETLNYANVTVFKLNEDEKHLRAFDKDRIVYVSPIKRERENSGRVQLKAGQKYVIIPSTEIAGNQGDVYMSIYLD